MTKRGDWGDVDPGSPLTNINDSGGGGGGGGPTDVHILYQKNHNFRMCLLKRVTTFFSKPKKFLNSFFATQKNPSVFHRPKRITFGQNFKPQKFTQIPPLPSLKYVSGAPGDVGNRTNFDVLFYTVII